MKKLFLFSLLCTSYSFSSYAMEYEQRRVFSGRMREEVCHVWRNLENHHRRAYVLCSERFFECRENENGSKYISCDPHKLRLSREFPIEIINKEEL